MGGNRNLTFHLLTHNALALEPLAYRSTKALHLLEKLSSHPLGVCLLVHRHVLFRLSYDTLLASFVLLPKSMLTLTTDGPKAGPELLDNQRQPVALLPYLLGLFLILAGTIENFHQLL
jgi:hypothetical protein